MSGDFVILLLCALFSAYGTLVALRRKTSPWTNVPAILVYALVGMHTLFLATLTGDGRILPGLQVSPEVKRYWAELYAEGSMPGPHPAFGLLVIVAHVLILLPRPDREGLWRPMPATLAFVGLFLVLDARAEGGDILHQRALGPERAAYLTIAPSGDGVRLVLAEGAPDDSFLRVRHVHEAEGTPPRPRVLWTKDGEGIVISILYRQLLAIDRDGRVVGTLPEKSHEWPRELPAAESGRTRRRFSQAQRDVAEFVKSHGGVYVR